MASIPSQTPSGSDGPKSNMDHLKDALTSLLTVDESEGQDEKNKFQQGLADILAKLANVAALQVALDAVLQSSKEDASPGLLKRVQFFSDIHLIVSNDSEFTAYICRQKPSGFPDIARKLYHTPQIPPSVSDEKIQAFCSYLFQNEPTAVLLGLIERASIKLPTTVKTSVVTILSDAIDDGFDISRNSTRALLKQITFPASVTPKTKTLVVEAIKKIQRLQALVREPEHVGLLASADYDSATSIANTELAAFQEEMVKLKMPKDVAGRIHDHALTVQIRNEQAWALALNEKNNNLLPKAIVNKVNVKPGLDLEDQRPGGKKRINLTTLFRDMDTVACTECSSVLSPSAYFVDLLRLLQDTKSTSLDKVTPATLFAKLMERRPDLQHLKLSCANTNSLVPYLDLVTEILESFISELSLTGKLGGPKAIESFDAPSVDADGVCTSQPRNTNYDVYNRVVAKEVFPMETFPYSLSMHTIRELLSAAGTSRYDVITKFASVDRLMSYLKPLGEKKWNAGDSKRLKPHFVDMIDRFKVAEYLGLGEEDFMAICRESFQPLALWQARNKESARVISLEIYRQDMGVPTAADLWGYSSTESMTGTQVMLDEVSGQGLTFIRLQLLDRALITMQDLQDILKTQFMGRRLIITTSKVSTEGSKPVFTGALSEMRMRVSVLGSRDSSTLTQDVCHDLQAFIRLWKKMKGWSISDLDTVLSTLKRKSSGPVDGISPSMLQDLAAVKVLANTTAISPSELQVLWGDIDTNGPHSLYTRVFLAPRVVLLDRYFQADAKGDFLKSGETISQHRPALLSTLQVFEADVQAILSASSVVGNDGSEKSLNGESQLTLANLSVLYRTSLICRVFDIKPDQLNNFRRLFPKLDVFESPRETLVIFDKYTSLCKAGWTIEGIFQVMEMGVDPHVEEMALSASSKIASAKLEIERKDQTAIFDDVGTDAEFRRILPLLFDASSALNVSKHFDDNPTTREEVIFSTVMIDGVKIPQALVPKLSCINFDQGKKGRITLTGLLSKDESEAAVAILPDDSNWKEAITSVYDKARSIFDLICRQLRINDAAIGEAEKIFFLSGDSASKQRKTFFVKKALPLVNAQLLRQTIMDSVAVSFPIPAAPLTALIGDIIRYISKAGDASISAYEALRSIKLHDASEESFQGFFCPPGSGKFQFVVENGSTKEPQLSVNGVKLEFTNALGIWKSNWLEGRLISGKYYTFSFTGNIEKQISYTTQDSLTPSTLRSDMFVSMKSRDLAVSVYQKLASACKVVLDEGLSLMEVEYCQKSNMIDFNNIAFEDLIRVNSYRQVRDNTAKERSEYPLEQFLSWASAPGSSSKETLSKLSLATGWSEQQVEGILTFKYPAKRAEDRLKLFGDETELVSINQILTLMKNINLPTVEALDLFKIATPTEARAIAEKAEVAKLKPGMPNNSTAQVSSEMSRIAATLRLATSSSTLSCRVSSAVAEANNKLRETQRTILIQYLLNHKKVKAELDIQDADDLFEYFLIDVKMGAKLQTSRMRQAISTVQLFVQRCNLGLELIKIPQDKTQTPPNKAYEVKCNTVSSIRWQYMAKFSLWVGHRKLFLYPENWIDPTIRDNRTEPFKALEGALSQSNLNAETVSTAIKAYIYQMNEISDLEVLSYVRQYVDVAKSKFHFFAKTRQGPFQYYYRYADVGSGQLSDIRWAPWSKIDIEIPSIETDIDGNPLQVSGAYVIPVVTRGRLFLYIPQFMAQNRPQKPESTKFSEFTTKSPSDVASKKLWEMKLGWTEYRNGKWTPKQTSLASLRFPDIQAPIVPPLHSLRFFVSGASSTGLTDPASHDTIYIDVQSWYQKSEANYRIPEGNVSVNRSLSTYAPTKQWPLGRFRIQGSQIHAIASDTATSWMGPVKTESTDLDQVPMTITENDHSLPTSFSKLWAKSIEKKVEVPKENDTPGRTVTRYAQQSSEPNIYQAGEKQFLLLAHRGLESNVEQEYTWTASFDKTRYAAPSALILQVADRSKSETFFAIPPANDKQNTSSAIHLFSHPSMGDIMERSTTYDDVRSVYTLLSNLSDTSIQDNLYGKIDNEYHEQSTPYALYHWELGMHAVSLVMERCAATQQYELALEVAKLVFDPGADAGQSNEVTRCWQFLPFKNITATESISDILRSLIPERPGIPSKSGNKVTEWKNNPFSPHSVARGRPNVYMKRFVLKYIEILVGAGDEYFRQNSLESIPLAIQRYVEASHLYGPVGKATPKLGKLPVKTFDEISIYVDAFSNAKVEMELDFPYSCEPCYRGAVNDSLTINPDVAATNTHVGLVQTGYFCLPPNPRLMEVRNLIDDRLFKIRNSLDINGHAITLTLFDPPLDPGVLAMAQAANLSPSVLLNDLDTPMPNYRFYYLLQKATEMCSELKVLGDQFLSAKEKKDAEALTVLLARNEVLSSTTQLSIKELQKKEAQKSIAALEEARKGSAMRLSYYLALIGESPDKIPEPDAKWTDIPQSIEKPTADDLRMTSYEKQEMDKCDSAADLSEKASVLELAAGALMAIPNLLTNMQPMGVGAAIKMDAENIAKLLQCTASALNLKGQMDLHDAQRAARKGAMIRQLQERRLQANTAGWEIRKIDKDLDVQRVRLALAESEIRAQQQQVERVQEVQEWHRTKYTNAALYSWLENSFRTLYHKTFLLTMQLARKAERSFQFEMASRFGSSNMSFLAPGGYWDSARDGLLSANNLYLGLKRLEVAYMEKRPYDYEISKNVSLRQVDPAALFSLRQTGIATFSLSESLFDMDFPGHYFRRIKSVGISIPAIVGPYTGLNCILSLTEHRTRVAPQTAAASETYAYKGRDDLRFQTDTIPISSIAVSHGISDSGTFELNFSGERYLPFEGAGCYSKWKLEFPAAQKQFDYNTISDVILHVRYTAIEGGLPMREGANTSVKEYVAALSGNEASIVGPTALLDLKNDFANDWYTLSDGVNKLRLTGLAERLPFFTRGRQCMVKRAVAYVCNKKGASDVGGITLLEPKSYAFEPPGDLKIQTPEGVEIYVVKEMNCDIKVDWELEVKKKENIENILLLFQYRVIDISLA